MMQDEVTVTLEAEDIAEAYRPAPRPKRLRILVLCFMLALTSLILILFIRFPESRAVIHDPVIIGLTGAILLVATLLVLAVVTGPWLRGYVGRRTLRDHPGLNEPIHYSFGEEEFRVHSTYTEAHYPWHLLWNWRETSRVIIVQPTPQNFYVFPKRGVDEGLLDRLRERLKQARKYKQKS